MSKEFFDAIRAGERDQVSAMLDADPALLTSQDDRGNSPFVAAKYSHRNDIAALLLERGVPLDFFAACMAGKCDRLQEMLDADQSWLNSYSHDGWTPLHLAAFFSQPDAVNELLARGANVNARARNGTNNMPLHAGASAGNMAIVRVLVEHGADVNARQEGGWTALHAAALAGNVEMAGFLISKGADIEARASNNQNALDLALTKGHQAMVNLLDESAARRHGVS
ncbi:MAG TPA: ankyrin repeat domain-containing protein [Bryobacteraceae bacterium]|nr:ankyrin repeat domain-containing protein [Bryobacteraceae bacterium]